VVRVVGLNKTLGDFRLREISFEAERGDYVVLLGPTGSGKTVLLETIAGINRPEAGEVWLDGQEVTRWPPESRGIGFVYQRSMLFPHLSVRANIAYGLRYRGLRGARARERVERVAALLGLADLLDRGVEGLSGGEMQKVALGRALAIEPRVLLLDEPLAPLDPVAKENLRAQLADLHRRTATTIVHVTHDQETARVLGMKVGVLRDGRLLQFGPRDEVFDRPNGPFVARFVGTENVFPAKATRDGELVRVRLGCGTIVARGDVVGEVGICIRPELISLDTEQAHTNTLRGVVESVSDRGPLVRHRVVTAQEHFVVLQTKRDYLASGVRVGEEVAIGFEPEAVHIFPWREE